MRGADRKRVRLVAREASRVEPLTSRGAELALAALDDDQALGRALEGSAGFYTLLPDDPSLPDFHRDRRRMVDAMAAAVRVRRVPHVVFLSAAAAMLPDGNGVESNQSD